MTQLLNPETLPTVMRRFADREGGLMWRQNKMPTYILSKAQFISPGVTRVVKFTASRTFDFQTEAILGAQYDWQESDQTQVAGSSLPDWLIKAAELDDEIVSDPKNTFRRSEINNTSLYLPSKPLEDIHGAIILDEQLQYDCNGDIFCDLPVIDGLVITDHDQEEALQEYTHEPAFGLQVVEYRHPETVPLSTHVMNEFEAMLYGRGSHGLVGRCTERMLAYMEFMRPPEPDEE